MLEMLDEYSKGKVLTIQTQKKRKIKKNKRKQRRQDDEIAEFQVDNELDDDEMDESDEEEENVERSFNFVSELSILVDYDVIDKFLYVLRNELQYANKPTLLQACSNFFRRIIQQTKQTWIFFQVETLSVFDAFNQKDATNNSLMKGL
jgi:hypothetical protein